MFSLEHKINTEQRFANLVYKDFQTKRFGLTPCCDVEIDEIKLKKYLCDYQEQKAYDDNLLPTEDLDRTVLDCDDLPVNPIPTPPDDIPIVEPTEACRSIQINGLDQRVFLDGTSGNVYSNLFNYQKTQSHSTWVKFPNVPSPETREELFILFSRYYLGGGNIIDPDYGLAIAYNRNIDSLGNVSGFFIFILSNQVNANQFHIKEIDYAITTTDWLNITLVTDCDDSNNTKFYVNGVEITSVVTSFSNLASSISYNNEDYEIGSITNTGLERPSIYTEFTVHSHRVWDTILSPAEIVSEFNLGFKRIVPILDGNCVLDIQCSASVWDTINTEYVVPENKLPTSWSTENALQTDLVNDCPQGI